MNRLLRLDTGFQVRLAVCATLLLAFSIAMPGFASGSWLSGFTNSACEAMVIPDDRP